VQGFPLKRRAAPVATGVLIGVGLAHHVVKGLEAPIAWAKPLSGRLHDLDEVVKQGAQFAVRLIW
jgi:hypothetical protein